VNPVTIRVWPVAVTLFPGGRPRPKPGDKRPEPVRESRDVTIAHVHEYPVGTSDRVAAVPDDGPDV